MLYFATNLEVITIINANINSIIKVTTIIAFIVALCVAKSHFAVETVVEADLQRLCN